MVEDLLKVKIGSQIARLSGDFAGISDPYFPMKKTNPL